MNDIKLALLGSQGAGKSGESLELDLVSDIMEKISSSFRFDLSKDMKRLQVNLPGLLDAVTNDSLSQERRYQLNCSSQTIKYVGLI